MRHKKDVKGRGTDDIERSVELVTRIAPRGSSKGQVERATPARRQRVAAARVVAQGELCMAAARQRERLRRTGAVVRDREGGTPVAGDEVIGVVVDLRIGPRADARPGAEDQIRTAVAVEVHAGAGVLTSGSECAGVPVRVDRRVLNGDLTGFARAKRSSRAAIGGDRKRSRTG